MQSSTTQATQEAKPQLKDFLAQLLDDPENQKLPVIKDVNAALSLVEQRIKKKANEHLGFVGDLKDHGELYVKYSDKPEETGFAAGAKYLGEWSKETNKPHGRGIRIRSSDRIYIQYYNNGDGAPGKYIHIWSSSVIVGEEYLKDGKKWERYTLYKSDGTTEEREEEIWI